MPTPTHPGPTLTIARANTGLGLLVMAAIALATVALLRPPAGASAVARATPTPVATIDLVGVITQLDEYTAVKAEFETEGKKKTAEIEALSEEIDGLSEDLERLDPNSDAFDQVFRERNMKAGFRELRGTMLIRWQSEDNARVLTELYEKALTAVADVAKRDGWELVVHTGQQAMVPRNPNIRAEAAMGFVEDWIQTRRVIYSGDSVDITSSVIQHMNNRFASGG